MQGGTTLTRTVDQPDGTRTVVRHEAGSPGNTGWHRHHRQCVAHWHHHQRVTRCWSH